MSDLVKRDESTGRFVKTPSTTPSIINRILNKVIVLKTNECWEWQGALNKGYGVMSTDNRTKQAHRVSYEAFVGDIPTGHVLDHLCRNTKCVNPAHLEPVLHVENVRRGNSGLNWRTKTHCPQEHEYTTLNTYIDTKGSRNCITCKNARRRKGYVAV